MNEDEAARAEKTVHDLTRIYQRIFDAAPNAFMVFDPAGEVVLANPAAELMFGYPIDRLKGMTVEELMPDRFRERHLNHRKVYSVEPRNRQMGRGIDLYGLRRDGVEIPVEIMLGPVVLDDGTYTIAIVRRRSGDSA